MSWRNCVNQVAGSASFGDIQALVSTSAAGKSSAIDRYYAATIDILTKVDPAYFSKYDRSVSSLLYVGLISATENYFRDILGSILSICPIARKRAAEKKVQLGSFLWGGSELHSRTAFDFIAFSSGENISKTMKDFVGHDLAPAGIWKRSLEEYDLLCELRHGIVHSGRVLSGKNALRLGLPRTKLVMRFEPTYATLQEAGSVCTSVVQSANNELFEALVTRWAVDWRRLPSWNKHLSGIKLREIFLSFQSGRDTTLSLIANPLSLSNLSLQVKTEFAL